MCSACKSICGKGLVACPRARSPAQVTAQLLSSSSIITRQTWILCGRSSGASNPPLKREEKLKPNSFKNLFAETVSPLEPKTRLLQKGFLLPKGTNRLSLFSTVWGISGNSKISRNSKSSSRQSKSEAQRGKSRDHSSKRPSSKTSVRPSKH